MKHKITKALAVLLMLCMLLPQTALAATTYYIEVSISGPDARHAEQTVSGTSSRYGTLNYRLAAEVVTLIRSKQSEIAEKFGGTGLRDIFDRGLAAFENDADWTEYVRGNFDSVGGDASFKRTLANKQSTLGALTVGQVNAVSFQGYVVTVTLRSYSTGSSGTTSGTTAETTTNPDGSTISTTTKPDGTTTESTISKPTTDASGNTSQTTTETTTGKDGTTESKTETTTKPDGSGFSTTTSNTTKPDGTTTESKTETTINKDGSSQSTTTSTVTNANGSTTETKQETTTTNTGDKTESTTVTTTEKDGSTTSTTTSITTEKNGTTTASMTETTAKTDGSSTEITTSTVTKPSGTVVESITETTTTTTGFSQSTTTSVTTKTDGSTVESTTNATTTVTSNKSTGTVTATTTSKTTTSDGVKSEGKTVTEIKKDGTVTSKETVKASTANGTTASKVTTTDSNNGTVTKAEANVSSKDASEAVKNNTAVTIPVEVSTTKDKKTAPTVTVNLPKDSGSVKVNLPVTKPNPGLVAIVVDEKGKATLVPKSVVTEDGLKMEMETSANVKIVDNGKSFQDVPAQHWANDAASFASARNLFQGVNETTFAPNRAMTRGMLATVLYRLESEPETTVEEAFTDVKDGAYYTNGISWASDKGVATGYDDGTYRPDQVITRQQLAAMLYRYAGNPDATGDELNFPDAANVSNYAKDAMKWAVENGIIQGKTDGRLDPHGLATRAQVATMMMRYCGHELDQ